MGEREKREGQGGKKTENNKSEWLCKREEREMNGKRGEKKGRKEKAMGGK